MLAYFKENISIIFMLLNSEKIKYLLNNNVSKNTFIYVDLLQSLYRPTWISLYLQFASVHTPFHLFCTQRKKIERKGFSSDLNDTNQCRYNITIYFNLVWIKKLKNQSGFMDKLHSDIKSKFPVNTDFTETLLTDIHFSLKPHR